MFPSYISGHQDTGINKSARLEESGREHNATPAEHSHPLPYHHLTPLKREEDVWHWRPFTSKFSVRIYKKAREVSKLVHIVTSSKPVKKVDESVTKQKV